MINKQVKIVGGGVNRSTPIDLKTIDSEVAKLVGRATQTPIGMKELWDEVQNLKNNMKQFEIVAIPRGENYTFTFDSKYTDWNFCVISTDIALSPIADLKIKDGNSFTVKGDTASNWTYSTIITKKNNTFQISHGANHMSVNNLTVLFYK